MQRIMMGAPEAGNLIRIARKKAGFSQQEIADKLGLDRSYISQVERGEKTPSTETLANITKLLKVNISSYFEALRNEISKEKIETSEEDGEEWVQRYVSDTGARVYFNKEYLSKLSPKTWRQIAAIIKEEFSEEDE